MEKIIPSGSGCVGFEPYGAEVVSWGQAYVGVQGGGQTPQQSDGGLGATFFDALDLIGGHISSDGQFGDAETQGAALVIDGFTEGQGLADGHSLGILNLLRRADPAGVVAGHHTCLS
jgi:hypothetical protein